MRDDRLQAQLEPLAARSGMEIEAVEVTPAGKRRVVRVVVDGDGPKGRGPTLDEIAEVTKAISSWLDDNDVLGAHPFTLEVSSRGVDRPLTQAKHFRRNRGRLVALSGAALAPLTGRIVSADDAEVVLDVNGTERRVPLADIGKAVVQIELNRKPDPEDEDETGFAEGEDDLDDADELDDTDDLDDLDEDDDSDEDEDEVAGNGPTGRDEREN